MAKARIGVVRQAVELEFEMVVWERGCEGGLIMISKLQGTGTACYGKTSAEFNSLTEKLKYIQICDFSTPSFLSHYAYGLCLANALAPIILTTSRIP